MNYINCIARAKPSRSQLVSGALLFTGGAIAYAVPYIFVAGTTISASQLNANFAELEARIVALEAKLASVSTVSVNGYPAVRFTGVNVQVVNGANGTKTSNGTGNIIIGYDEVTGSMIYTCSVGTDLSTNLPVTDATSCYNARGSWAISHKSGSHNLVIGAEHNYSRWGGLVAGRRNTINYDFASVAGGSDNIASGLSASVSGGWTNTATGENASVSGGYANFASGPRSSVSGGNLNIANGFDSSLSGGFNNVADGDSSFVAGGFSNRAIGRNASVSGGSYNDATGPNASISGGNKNIASGSNASVSGGGGCNASVSTKWAVGYIGTGCHPSLGN